jgi:citrate lyase synthetase
MVSHDLAKWYSFNLNLNAYHNQINTFMVENKYSVVNTVTADQQEIISRNLKFNNQLHLPNSIEVQIKLIYLAPDIIPQGKIAARYSIDLGIKKIQKAKGELFLNATDLLNTMIIKKESIGSNFIYTCTDYYETQVLRIGYSDKF